MKILFFIVHPSKYHLFKNVFKKLDESGIKYDILISSKDVLSELLDSAGLRYRDLFPNGRKIKGVPPTLNVVISFFRTFAKLYTLTGRENYSLYVTDDALTFLGKFRGVPSVIFTDNDLATIPKLKLMYRLADKIIAPESTDLEDLTRKKISFKGNKALAHLHPNYFAPDSGVMQKYISHGKKYIIIRLAKLNASHDIHGNPGITDENLENFINIVGERYDVKIIAEREIPIRYRNKILNVNPIDLVHVLSGATLFIGDSGTMATESAMLGVPNILINNIAKKCGVHKELESAGLQKYFDSYEAAGETIKSFLNNEGLKSEFQEKLQTYILEAEDFNEKMLSIIKELAK